MVIVPTIAAAGRGVSRVQSAHVHPTHSDHLLYASAGIYSLHRKPVRETVRQ